MENPRPLKEGGCMRLTGELVDGGQGLHVHFEGLIVLALDLQLGLQFFDEDFEARNFGF